MNRGSVVRVRLAVVRTLGFNEAPIHESGKSRLATAPAASSAGFNEAPIHESGKSLI